MQKMNVNNVPDYAWELPIWVVRFDGKDGSLWFWGAWNDKEQAVRVAKEINGIVITE